MSLFVETWWQGLASVSPAKPNPDLYLTKCCDFSRKFPFKVSGIVFTGPVHWTEKKTETELNPTAKDWTTGFGCTNSENFWLPVVRFVEKLKNRKKPI